jgi:flagella basal body P-ring formation protein FlgA
VAVETASQEVTMAQIEEVLDAAFKARIREKGGREEVGISLLHRPNPISLPPGELEIEVTDMDRPGSGVRNVQLAFRVDGKDVDTQTVPVRVNEQRRAIVAARDLEEGAVLKSKDFVVGSVQVLDREPKDEPVKDVAAVLGASLKSPLAEGDSINLSDIERIPISKKGEPVNLVKKVGNVRLSLSGDLQEDLLYIGQEVKVKVRKSKKEVTGKAIDDGTIQIR